MTQEERELLQKWERETKKIYRAHYDSSVQAQKMNFTLGIPTIALSAIVGTSVFAAIGKEPSLAAQVAVGFVSVIVTVLASLQTFLRYSERGNQHKETGAGFATLNREAAQLLASPLSNPDEIKQRLDSFRERWEELSRDAQTASPSAWKRANERDKKEYGATPEK